jgi:hypothetical protein
MEDKAQSEASDYPILHHRSITIEGLAAVVTASDGALQIGDDLGKV